MAGRKATPGVQPGSLTPEGRKKKDDEPGLPTGFMAFQMPQG